MWHHFFNLLNQGRRTFLAALGTTGLGWWVQGIIWFVATESATYMVVWAIRGKAAMKTRLIENFRIGLYAWVLVMVCVYGPIFGWHVIKAVYDDHQALVANITRLQSTAPCPQLVLGTNLKVRRDIQKRLSDLMKHGYEIRDAWLQKALGKPKEQEKLAHQVRQWHSGIESNLRSIPRGSFYMARLNSSRKPDCGGYPNGINYDACRELELLLGDLSALEEFGKDPELGEP